MPETNSTQTSSEENAQRGNGNALDHQPGAQPILPNAPFLQPLSLRQAPPLQSPPLETERTWIIVQDEHGNYTMSEPSFDNGGDAVILPSSQLSSAKVSQKSDSAVPRNEDEQKNNLTIIDLVSQASSCAEFDGEGEEDSRDEDPPVENAVPARDNHPAGDNESVKSTTPGESAVDLIAGTLSIAKSTELFF